MDKFTVKLIAMLDSSRIKGDFNKIQRELNKKNINLKTVLDYSNTKKEIKELANEIKKILENVDPNYLGKIKTTDIISVIKQSSKEAEKALKQTNRELDRQNKIIKSIINSTNKMHGKVEQVRPSEEKRQQPAHSKTINQSINDTFKKVENIDLSIETRQYEKEISNITYDLSRFETLSSEVFTRTKLSVDQLVHTYEKLEQTTDNSKKLELEKEYHKQLDTTKNLLSILKDNKDNEIIPAGDSRRINLINELNNYLAKNTAMNKENRQSIQQWIGTLSSSDDMLSGAVDNITLDLQSLDSHLEHTGQLGLSWSDKLKQIWDKLGGWNLDTITIAISYAKKAFGELKEIDNILTNIGKGMTKSELKELGNTAFDSASKYGIVVSDYLTTIEEMSQSGFYGEQGIDMAEQVMLAQAAGNLTKEIANNYILATNAAYNYNGEAKKINEVLDGQNNITNKHSVSLKDMALAMSEVGTIASSYGVSIENLSAMIGTIGAVTNIGGSEVGNSIESILTNLQDIDSSKIADTLNKANVSMYEMVDGTKKLRDPISILRDLADTFNKLDKANPMRTEILNNIGGIQQASKLSALFENMDMFDKMLINYSQGTGSALANAEKSANNLTGSLNELRNTWTSIINNIVNPEQVTPLVQSLNELMSIVNVITGELGTLGTAGLLTAIGLTVKNVGVVKVANNELNLFGMGITSILGNLKNAKVVLNAYKSGIDKADASTQLLAVDTLTGNKSLSKYISSTDAGNLSLKGYIGSLIGAKVATTFLHVATLTLNAVMSLGISSAIDLFAKWVNGQRESTSVALEAINAYEEQHKSLNDLIGRYSELKQALDKGNLSVDESRSIKEKLLEVQKLLFESYGDEVKNIDIVNGRYQDQLDILNGIKRKKANDTVQETREEYDKASKRLKKEKVYDLGAIVSWNDFDSPQTDEQKKLLEYIKKNHSNAYLFDPFEGKFGYHELKLQFKLENGEAEKELRKIDTELEKYANENDIDISNVLRKGIPKMLKKAMTKGNKEDIELTEGFPLLEIERSHTLSSLEQESEKAVFKYNTALSSGEGIEKAKNNLDLIKQSVKDTTLELKDSQQGFDKVYDSVNKHFDSIFDSINKSDEIKHEISESLKNDDVAKQYAEQLRGFDDLNLESINLSNIEDPFVKLVNHLKLSSDEVPILINKLVELGIVQGSIPDLPSVGMLDEDEIKAMEKFISLTKSVETALKDISKLSTADILGLMNEHPDFDWIAWGVTGAEGAGDLEGALKALVDRQYKLLSSTLQSNEGIKDLYDSIAENQESVKSITELMDSLQKTYTTIDDVEKEIKDFGDISADTISKLILSYPELTGVFEDYLAGVANGSDIVEHLNKVYDQEKNQYKKYIIGKTKLNSDFIENIKNIYGIDLSNHKEYAKAKLKIENELEKRLGEVRHKRYYNKETGRLKEDELAQLPDKYQEWIREQYKPMDELTKAMEEIDKIDIDFSNLGLDRKEKKTEKDNSQTFDWISRKLEVLKQQFDNLKKRASDIFLPFTTQNKELNKAIHNVTSQISIQKKAYNSYMKKANSAGLSDSLKRLVQNGDVKIESYGEATAKKIEEYKQWYDEAQKVKQTISDLRYEEKELIAQRIDKIAERYSTKIDNRNATISKLQSQIDLKELRGESIKEKDYTNLINYQKKNLKDLQSEYSKINIEFDKLVKSNKNFEYSPEWYKYKGILTGIQTDMSGTNQEIINLKNNILDLRWKPFDDMLDKLDHFKSEISSVMSLLDGDDFDKAGNVTNIGLTRLGLNYKGIENSRQTIANAQYGIKQLNEQFKNGEWALDDYNKKMSELQDIVLSSASDIKSYENAIIDFKRNAIDLETKSMQEYIKQKKDALQAEKDLHEYKKSIESQEKDITILRKKIAALALSEDRKDIAERLKLEKQLRDSEEKLTEAQSNHDFQNKQEAYDKDLEEFEKLQEDKLYKLKNDTKEQEKVIKDYLKEVQENHSSVFIEISNTSDKYGIDLTKNLTSPWASAKTEAENYFEYISKTTANIEISTKRIDTTLPMINTGVSIGAGAAASTYVPTSTAKSTSKTDNKSSTAGMVSDLIGNIKKGDTGAKVTALQEALKELKYNIGSTGADGKFGAATETAVKKFQKDNSVAQDGIVGTETKKKFKLKGYKRGTKGVKKNELAWTQEDGRELIIKPTQRAILTPLEKGDGVPPNNLTENLFKWGELTPNEFFKINKFNHNIMERNNHNNTSVNAPINISITGVARDDINTETLNIIRKEAPTIISKAVLKTYNQKGGKRKI